MVENTQNQNPELLKIIQDLNKVQGLTVIDLLKEKHKTFIQAIENKNNLGVLESIKRQHTLLVTHDSTFRAPTGEIVKFKNNQTFFPTVPFSELNNKAFNIVSSSPSKNIHKKLIKDLNIKLKPEEATLLLGFDLK